uniref:Uncharacterized protein n=1 Tax=Anopheles christyi TaxID=43041 RepID=A0A182K8S8_9DIPT
ELEDLSPRSAIFSPRESPKVTGGSSIHRSQQPRTTPVSSTATRFPFDPPMSPKTYSGGVSRGDIASFACTHETMFSFDESPNPVRRPLPKLSPPSLVDHTPDHSPNKIDSAPRQESIAAKERATELTQPQKQFMEQPQSGLTSTPKRLMNSFKTRKERLVQQAGSAVAAATAVVTSAGASGKPFKNPNYDPDLTMFPFDREAIDYDRIQRECFAVEEELLFEHERRNGNDEYRSVSASGCGESPSKGLFDAEIFSDHYSIFQQYAYLTQQETRDPPTERNAVTPSKRNRVATTSDAFSPHLRNDHNAASVSSVASQPRLSKFDQIVTKFDLMPSKSGGSATAAQQLSCGTLPDLRVDYFAETSCCGGAGISVSPSGERTSESGKARASSPGTSLAVSGGGGLRSMEVIGTGALVAGAINVTPNPMEGAVCTQPRATIVVQQNL